MMSYNNYPNLFLGIIYQHIYEDAFPFLVVILIIIIIIVVVIIIIIISSSVLF